MDPSELNGLIILIIVVLGSGLAARALPSGGYWWDFLAALGYCAFALIAFMGWESEAPGRNPRLRLHRNLALLGSLIVTAHAVGYLVIDPVVIEYLLPAAPAYMLMGIAALLLLLGSTISSLPGPRRRTYSGFPAFQRWHRVLFLLLLTTTSWHVIGTGFSLSSLWQTVPLALLLAGAPALAYCARRLNRQPPMSPEPQSQQAADLQPVLIGALMVTLSACFAGIKVFACSAC